MATFIPVISLAEAKEFLLLLPPSATLTSEDTLVSSLCDGIAEEIRAMTNRAEDADFNEIKGNPKVRHVAFQMLQWYFHQHRLRGDRLGMLSIVDTMNGASATTVYESAETMDKRWRRELRSFRIYPL